MARCGTCSGEFEGNRQPNCPLCGAARPRPRLRPVPDPVDMTAVLESLGADPEPRKKLRRRRKLHIGKEAAEAILASPPTVEPAARPPVPPAPRPMHEERPVPAHDEPPREPIAAIAPPPTGPPNGPPPIEVEYIFGGAVPDAIVPVTTIAILPARDDEDERPLPSTNAVITTLDRARKVFRRG